MEVERENERRHKPVSKVARRSKSMLASLPVLLIVQPPAPMLDRAAGVAASFGVPAAIGVAFGSVTATPVVAPGAVVPLLVVEPVVVPGGVTAGGGVTTGGVTTVGGATTATLDPKPTRIVACGLFGAFVATVKLPLIEFAPARLGLKSRAKSHGAPEGKINGIVVGQVPPVVN